MALSKLSSSECEFVEKTSKDFDCPVCFQFIWNPFLTACCGNHFCDACVKFRKEENNQCPFCNEKPIIGIIDKKFQRQINELQVYCLYKKRGCSWVGELGKLIEHLEQDKTDGDCKFVQVSCSLSCGKAIFRCELEEHLNMECPLRVCVCEYCGFSSTYEDVTTIHYSNCPNYPVVCPNSCSEEKLKRSSLDYHLLDCPNEVVSCSFNEMGCEERTKRRCLQEHIEANVIQHQLMICNAFKNVKKENESLKDGFKNVKEENESLKDEFKNVKKENESLKDGFKNVKEENESLKDEFKNVKKENESLKDGFKNVKKENESLKDEFKNVKKENESLKDGFKNVKKENESLKDDIKILKRSNEELQKNDATLKSAQSRMNHSTIGFVLKMDEEVARHQWKEYFSSLAMVSTNTPNPVCPVIIKWPDYSEVKQVAKDANGSIFYYTRPFYTHHNGYKMQLRVYPYAENNISIYCHLMQGENDDHLKWPYKETITITLLNQLEDSHHVTKNFRLGNAHIVKKPEPDTTRNDNGWGYSKFISLSEVESATAYTQYLVNDTLYLQIGATIII